MSDLRQAAQQALEALEKYSGALTHFNERIDHGPAITALKAALEQQAEPVAWMYSDDYERMTTSETFCTVFSVKVGSPDKGVTDIQLYTAPPPRKPLTDEMRKQMKEASDSMVMRGAFANGWLSAEAAHNIKEAV